MKKKFLILLIVFFGCLYNLSAYINIPPSPDSISNEKFTYKVSYKTTDLGNYFFGIIKIESNTEPKYYFTVPIYVIRINEYLEGDVQWVFIKNIEFKNSKTITIINRANDIFEFNINTYEVKCITKRSRVFDFDINSFNLLCDPSGTDSIVKDLYEIDLDEELSKIQPEYNGIQPEEKKLLKIEEVIKVSENILFDLYGIKTIRDEMPYYIYKYKNKWFVKGTLPDEALGGVFKILINADTSKIESIIHGE